MIHDLQVSFGPLIIAMAEPHCEGFDTYHRWFGRDQLYSVDLDAPG